MNAHQIHADQILAAVLLAIRLYASVYLNLKEIHQLLNVCHHKVHVVLHHVDRIHNVHDSAAVLLNAHVYRDILKVQILFEVVLNNVIHASQIHAVLVHHVMYHAIQFVIVQNRLLVIRSDNAHHQQLFENYANLAHVEVRFYYRLTLKICGSRVFCHFFRKTRSKSY